MFGNGGASIACSHVRAVEYFIETIPSNEMSPSFPCENMNRYTSGKCFQRTQLGNLGIDWQEQNVHRGRTMYLMTESHAPFLGKTVIQRK